MTAVHATPAFHPHEALGPLNVNKVVFYMQPWQRMHSMIWLHCHPAWECALCEKNSKHEPWGE